MGLPGGEAAAEWRRGAAVRAQALGPATEMMLDLAKVDAGSRVLDVGAGAGDATLAAAQRVGPNGRVLATDISASMLEIAAESARHAGLSNVGTLVVDAQRLDLESDSFDAAVSRHCLMLLPDYHQTLTQIRRVLKPGGRFAALVFSTPDRCPHISIPHAIVFRVGRLTSPAPERFGEFRLGAPGMLEEPTARLAFGRYPSTRFLFGGAFPPSLRPCSTCGDRCPCASSWSGSAMPNRRRPGPRSSGRWGNSSARTGLRRRLSSSSGWGRNRDESVGESRGHPSLAARRRKVCPTSQWS